MTNKARVLDIGKNIAIALLLCSMIFLLLEAVTVSSRGFLENLFGSGPTVSTQDSSKSAARAVPSLPSSIVLTDENGSHFVAKYDTQAKEQLFSQFSATLGEALGTAGNAKEIKEADWRAALGKAGVFFEYHRALPLDIIALYLGTHISSSFENVFARRLFLGQVGSDIYLYYMDDSSGSFYRMETALSFSAVSARLTENTLSRGSFAFEADGSDYQLLEPYFVFSEENLQISAPSSVLPALSLESGQVSLESFDMNERASKSFPESDGTMVYVDGTKSLRIGVDGSVIFTVTGSGGLPVEKSGSRPTLNECIAAAADLLSFTIAPNSGNAGVGLIDIENGANRGNYTLSFGYYVNGIPVELANTGWCAKIRINGGYIVRAELIYRQYSVSSENLSVLPENLAVVAALKKGGGEPMLIYDDVLGTVSANWTLN